MTGANVESRDEVGVEWGERERSNSSAAQTVRTMMIGHGNRYGNAVLWLVAGATF